MDEINKITTGSPGNAICFQALRALDAMAEIVVISNISANTPTVILHRAKANKTLLPRRFLTLVEHHGFYQPISPSLSFASHRCYFSNPFT